MRFNNTARKRCKNCFLHCSAYSLPAETVLYIVRAQSPLTVLEQSSRLVGGRDFWRLPRL